MGFHRLNIWTRQRIRRAGRLSLALLVLGVVLGLPSPMPDNVGPDVAVSSLSMPDIVAAGTIVAVDVASDSLSGVARVQVVNAYGRLGFAVPVSGGVGRLVLPAAVTQQAGELTVMSGDIAAQLTITPGAVAEVVAPLVGPRTIVADRNDVTLAVVLPVDRYGNQVADGTPVSIEWQQPAPVGEPDRVTRVEIETASGMVSTLVSSGDVAGPTSIRAIASSDANTSINGAAVRIDEVPGTVDGIVLTSAAPKGVADGRSLVEVETGELFDAFGNQLADGTVGQFVFTGPSGRGVVPGTVQNGVLRIEVVAPDRPGTLTGHIELQGQQSNDVSIEFASAIDSFLVRVDVVGSDVLLRIDSALDDDGAFVADGTEVRWGDQRTQIRQGSAEIRLPAALVPADMPPVEILGLARRPIGTES